MYRKREKRGHNYFIKLDFDCCDLPLIKKS